MPFDTVVNSLLVNWGGIQILLSIVGFVVFVRAFHAGRRDFLRRSPLPPD